MADEKVGINELSDAVGHLAMVSVHLVKLMKDGLNLSDMVALAEDAELKGLLGNVMQYKEIIAEAKDLDLSEGLQLAVVLVPKIVDAIKA